MNRNILCEIDEISDLMSIEQDKSTIQNFIMELLTESELETLSKRWRILRMLKDGVTQRQISKELKVSLCKVTRGSQILKKTNSIVRRYLTKEM